MKDSEGHPPGKNQAGIKWLKEGLLLAGVLLLSALIVFVLIQMQDTFNVTLQSYSLLAYIIVFVASLLSSATIFIPAPGIAVVLAAATQWDPLWVGLAAGTGDALGETTSYWTGYMGEKIIVDEHMGPYQKVVSWVQKYGTWPIFGIALVPILPYDLVGLAAGALKEPFWKFLLATWCGKVPRVLAIVYFSHALPAWLFPMFR